MPRMRQFLDQNRAAAAGVLEEVHLEIFYKRTEDVCDFWNGFRDCQMGVSKNRGTPKS